MILRSAGTSIALVCFVEHEQEGPAEHGAGKTQPLALAAGNERAAFAEHGVQPCRQAGHEIVDTGNCERVPDLGVAGLWIGP
jgi:hypothetical protein